MYRIKAYSINNLTRYHTFFSKKTKNKKTVAYTVGRNISFIGMCLITI